MTIYLLSINEYLDNLGNLMLVDSNTNSFIDYFYAKDKYESIVKRIYRDEDMLPIGHFEFTKSCIHKYKFVDIKTNHIWIVTLQRKELN